MTHALPDCASKLGVGQHRRETLVAILVEQASGHKLVDVHIEVANHNDGPAAVLDAVDNLMQLDDINTLRPYATGEVHNIHSDSGATKGDLNGEPVVPMRLSGLSCTVIE